MKKQGGKPICMSWNYLQEVKNLRNLTRKNGEKNQILIIGRGVSGILDQKLEHDIQIRGHGGMAHQKFEFGTLISASFISSFA